MKLTPLDIQKKEFSRSFRGLNEDEVKDFLKQVYESYEQLYKENKLYEEKIKDLEEKINYYKNMEETLKETLIIAKKTAEEVKKSAEKEKELIIKEAKQQANRILEEANVRVVSIKKEHEEARKQFSIFKTRFKSFLESQLEMIENEEWFE